MIPYKEVMTLITMHETWLKDRVPVWARYIDQMRNTERRSIHVRDAQRDRILESDDMSLDTNYAYGYTQVMLANICPLNPQVTVLPTDELDKDIARARERLLNQSIRDDKLRVKVRRSALWTSIAGYSPWRTTWDTKHKRPVSEVMHPARLFWDYSEEFEESDYYICVRPMKLPEFKRYFESPSPDVEPTFKDREAFDAVHKGNYPKWIAADVMDANEEKAKTIRDAFKWVVLYEVWDMTASDDKRYSLVARGLDKPLYQGPSPYPLMPHPFSLLTFADDLETSRGISDMQIIETMQARLRELDQLELEHIHTSIPREFVNEAAFSDPESAIQALQDGTEPGSLIRLSLLPDKSIRDAIMTSGMPSLNYDFEKMRNYIRQGIELVLGIPAYLRGGVGNAEVATELALVDTATQTRNGVRIGMLNALVANLARQHMALWEQHISSREAVHVRLLDTKTFEAITDFSIGVSPETGSTADSVFFYDVVGHSPTENHKMVQLQKLQQYMSVLLQNPNVDPAKLVQKLLELLGMDELFTEAPPPAPPPAPGAAMPGGEGGEDVTATGGMPPGAMDDEAILPPGARMLADSPAVET